MKKATGANSNTYELTVAGVSVNPARQKGQHINVRVMFTSDKTGETLSLYDSTTKKMVIAPFGKIEKLVQYARQQTDKGCSTCEHNHDGFSSECEMKSDGEGCENHFEKEVIGNAD